MLFYFRLGMRDFFFHCLKRNFVFTYFVWDYSVFKGCSCDLGFPFFLIMIFSGYSVAYSNVLLLFKGWYCGQNAQCFPFRICGYNLLIWMFLPFVK